MGVLNRASTRKKQHRYNEYYLCCGVTKLQLHEAQAEGLRRKKFSGVNKGADQGQISFYFRLRGLWQLSICQREMNNGGEATAESSLRCGVERRIPFFKRQVAGEPPLRCAKRNATALDFDRHRPLVKPAQHMADVDVAAILVDDDALLPLIAVPPLHCLRLGVHVGDTDVGVSFRVGPVRLAAAGNAPVKTHGRLFADDGHGVVFCDCHERSIVADPDSGVHVDDTSGNGQVPNLL